MSVVELQVRRTRMDILKGIAANVLRPEVLSWYVAGALAVAAFAVILNIDQPIAEMLGAGATAFFGMLFGYSAFLAICVWLAARKTWKSPGGLDPLTYTFSDDGLSVRSSVGHGTSSWIVWKAAFETSSLIVIRHNFNLLHILPKRDIAAEVLPALRSILRAHLKSTRLRSEQPA